MTTQPDSSSPSSSSSPPYDVFLSFRGADTRTTFIDHLRNALVGKGIHTFIDDDELQRGEEIKPALVKAIEDSRISVIVFSENYASSRWCLDELVEILRCKQSKQQIVLPIFYKVDPYHVRHQRSSYGDAFVQHERKFKDDKEKVLKWRRALMEAANLSGWHFKEGEYEAIFINNIVDGIFSKALSRTYWNVAKHPVGIQSHIQDVKKLLDVGGNGRRMVGIWGTSGIGKTTIAKAIWNAIAHEFQGSCFLENVREGSLIQLQETLLDKILGKNWKIQSVDEGIGVIKERLRHKKILLILDDVDQLGQLEKLAGDDWFGKGSRVIITTKNRRLLNNREIELIYEVKKLDYNQTLELFSWHAFGRSEPPKDYLELAQRAIAFADGLPLAIAILGSHLRGIDIRRWQVILDGYEGEPYTNIERILHKSYDDLDDCAKEYFLDIACFFKGEYKDYVLQIVPQKFIEEFIDKALITIEWSKILMHDLLANLGKDIVHKESPNDPGQRSRLWFYEDVKQVLTENNAGTRNIKGITVKLLEPVEITLNPECFRNMVNLQIFINCNASLCGDITYLPNALRWIDWHGYQLQSLPPNFLGKLLAVFKMPHSDIRELERFKHSSNLTSMNLRGCQFLEKISDLSGIPNIKYLILSQCTRLVEIDDSVGLLDKLVELNLTGCVKLTRFGTRLRLKSLEKLDLSDCKRLESFPKIEVEMESLRRLYMNGSGIRELPPSIAYLTRLRPLDLRGCFNLSWFATLRSKSLEIDLSYCKRLESFPEIELEMESLRRFDMNGSGIRELPPSTSYLIGHLKLNLRGCSNLTRFATLRLKSLEQLVLRDCKRLESFPKIEVEMKSLWRLDINGSGIRELPPSIAYLTGLRVLDLGGCFNLTRFAALRLKSLEELVLRDCKRLESFPEIEVEMESLWRLDINGSGIRELPPSIAYLTGLRVLDLGGCFNLTRFATLRLKSLEELDLRDCERLESFPEIEVEMESLRILRISRSGVRELPSSIAYLTGLQVLQADHCENLTSTMNSQVSSSNSELQLLPNLSEFTLRGCNLSKIDFLLPLDCWSTLTELYLSGNNFVNLPRCFSKFVNLQNLDLSDCKSLLEVPEQVLPPRIRFVSLDNCTSLEKIPEMAWVLLDNCTSLKKIPEFSPVDYSMYLSLINCVRLRGYHMTENIFLNQVSVSRPHCHFEILLPGDEVPKWFSCRKDATLVKDEEVEYCAGCKVSFEIPPNLRWETLRLVLCVVAKISLDEFIVKILVDGEHVKSLYPVAIEEGHVWLKCIPLLGPYDSGEPLKQGNMCRVIFDLPYEAPPEKITCGVHLLGHRVADVSETDVDHGSTQWLLPDEMAVDDDDMKRWQLMMII